MYKPRIKHTQEYFSGPLTAMVHEGKLILLDKLNLEVYAMKGDLAKNSKTGKLYIHNGAVLSSKKMYPIIISATEEVEIGDKAYFAGEIITWSEADENGYNKYAKKPFKIIALPEHFSKEHLKAIVDGKVKDGDKVWIKCEYYYPSGMPGVDHSVECIDLNQQNHITLFLYKQTLDEVAKSYAEQEIDKGLHESGFSLTQIQRKIFIRKISDAVKFGVERAKNIISHDSHS